jgi:hypothetical protein
VYAQQAVVVKPQDKTTHNSMSTQHAKSSTPQVSGPEVVPKVVNGHDTDAGYGMTEVEAFRLVITGDGKPIDIAVAYGCLGVPVYPVSPDRRKKPYFEKFFDRATTNPRKIREMWTAHPDGMIATPSKAFLLVDCDNPKKLDGEGKPTGKDGIGNAMRRWGSLDELTGARFYSGSDGINMLFRVRPGEHPICSASAIAEGIDIKGRLIDDANRPGGQIVLPGSRRLDGPNLRYRWCEDVVAAGVNPLEQAAFAPEALIRDAMLTTHERHVLEGAPQLAAVIAEAAPGDIRRLIEEHEAAEAAKQPKPDPVQLSTAEQQYYREWALKHIADDVAALTAMSPGGRDATVYGRACRWAWTVGGGFLSRAELVDLLFKSCGYGGNKLVKTNSVRGVLKWISNGIDKYQREKPPELRVIKARRAKEAKAAKATKAHTNSGGNGITPPPPPREPLPETLPDSSPPGRPSSTFALAADCIGEWPHLTAEGLPVARSQENIRHFFAAARINLSHNAFTEQQYISHDGAIWPITDDIIARIRMAMHREGFNPPERFFDVAILDIALGNSWHPIREYLHGLKWDGVARLDTWLTNYLGAEDTELHRAWGRCHLLAAVKRVMEPGTKHDEILVFEGEQGLGKSTAIATLAGPQFFTDALKIGQDSKETIELTTGVWLAEMPELEGISGKEAASVKSMLSKRRPPGHSCRSSTPGLPKIRTSAFYEHQNHDTLGADGNDGRRAYNWRSFEVGARTCRHFA